MVDINKYLTADINQFGMTAIRGQRVEFGFGGVVATAVVDASEPNVIKPGDAVTVVSNSTGVLHVKKAAVGDMLFGVALYNAKEINMSYAKGSYLSVGSAFTLVNMVAKTAITALAPVYYDFADGNVTVTASATTIQVGLAYESKDGSGADGALVRVIVMALVAPATV
jgi:hypothetical protein